MAWKTRKTYKDPRGKGYWKAVNEGLLQLIIAANLMLSDPHFGGEKEGFWMYQGSWSGAKASAGTHTGPDAMDISPYNWWNRVKVLRILGMAAWLRRAIKNLWSAHIHAITMGGASNAQYQEDEYVNDQDGLKGSGRDPKDHFRPSVLPILFKLNADLRPRYCITACHVYEEPAATTRWKPVKGDKNRTAEIKVGDKIDNVVAVVRVKGKYWFVTKDGRCGYEDNFSITPPEKREPVPIPEPEYELERLEAEWKVTHGPKHGLDGPHGERKYERAAGYHLFTKLTTEIDGHRWYITEWGTWYDDTHLEPWTGPVEPEVPEVPPKDVDTIWDHGHWNVASAKPGWFPHPWKTRENEIGALLSDLSCSIVTVNETHYSYMTRDILDKLGKQFTHVSSPIGSDLFFDHEKWKRTRPYKEYDLKAQNRRAGVLHLERRETGEHQAVVNTHFPNGSASLRSVAARNLVKLLKQVDGPIFLTGDFNNQAFGSGTPHRQLRDFGYEWLREQAKVTNGSKPEFPKKGMWLCDIGSDPDELALISGALILSPSDLSDHRPFKARGRISA